MKRLLSPGLLWPLFVVALLLTSVGMSVFAVMASRSDGGVQPVPDYYAQATQYDAMAREQAESHALGWRVEMAAGALQPSGLRQITLALRDADGAPLADLTGELAIRRAADAEPSATVPFHALDAGRYAAALPMQAAGLWDVTIHARRGADHFVHTLRLDVSG